MVPIAKTRITLQHFLASPEIGNRCELVDGEMVPKVSPKRFHSKTQRALLRHLEAWGDSRGEVGVEWAVLLTRQGTDWVPVPDLSFIYADRLPADLGDEACPVPVDLAVEIISPEQTFGTMVEKATDYLVAGVVRVWVVDPRAKTITVLAAQCQPITYRGDRPITDDHFPGLSIVPQTLFTQAGLLG